MDIKRAATLYQIFPLITQHTAAMAASISLRAACPASTFLSRRMQ
ncbi:MAG: hypothetical protein AAF310_05935 [Myxococcota bacterium]